MLPVLDQFKPELLLVSAGFDAHEADPLAQMRATESGLGWMTFMLRVLADQACDGRIVLVTEGGYALPALGASLDVALRALDERVGAVSAPTSMQAPTGRAERTLAAVRSAHAERWSF